MKTINPVFFTFLCAIFSSAANAVVVPDGNVLFSNSSQNVKVGDSFTMNLAGQGFTEELVGGGLNLVFNPAVLRLDNVAFDPVWDFITAPDAADLAGINMTGRIDPMRFETGNNSPTGNFAIATLSFTALAVGASSLDLSANSNYPFASKVTGVEVVPALFDGSVNVSAVPEPMSVGMMLAGLGLLGARVRLARR